MATIHETLRTFTNESLIELVFHLMDKLNQKERLEFISKYISAEIALEAIGYDSSSYLTKVSDFCRACLNGDYYTGPEYDDYYGEDSYDNMNQSDWSKKFSEYLKVAIMYSRNKNYEVSYQSFEKLLECVHEAEFDEGLLGTDNPIDYINTDWEQVFLEYFASMKNEISDKEELTNKAIDAWLNFGERCLEGILKYLDDITIIEKTIRKNISDNAEHWAIQHQLYELLKSFYNKLGVNFDEIDISESMVKYNPYFLNDVAGAYMNSERWDKAVKVIEDALEKLTGSPILNALNTKLVDCYEKLGLYGEAFDVTVQMFHSCSSDFYSNSKHNLYKRARFFAEMLCNISTFVDSMEKYIQSNKEYGSLWTLLRIYSFEGHVDKLITTALKSDSYSRHDYLKYTSKSLIYRALGEEAVSLPDLNEYIESIKIGEIEGIVDMVRYPDDIDKKEYLLDNSLKVLKLMVQFHIDAAKRSRYARAAYYCAVLKDICIYLDKKEDFDQYYNQIIYNNSRRPALRDEFRQKMQ